MIRLRLQARLRLRRQRRNNRPCHVAYPPVPADEKGNLTQGIAVCLKCGELHTTKPRLSDAAVSRVIGGTRKP